MFAVFRLPNEPVEKVDSESAAQYVLVLAFLLAAIRVVYDQSNHSLLIVALTVLMGPVLPFICMLTHRIGVFSADYAPYNTTSTGYLPSSFS